MNPPQAIFILIFFFFLNDYHYVSAQSSPIPPYIINDLFRPSLAIIVGVFSMVFSLTIALLVYAKCFHNDLESEFDEDGERRDDRVWQGIFSRSSRLTGLNKTAIESLPFFKFSALKGSKHGLECSVCLSKFEDVEILRLLPKCRHAFHIECIDEWLEKHATCPLCRNRVSIEDAHSVLSQSNNSLTIMSNSSEPRQEENLNVEIYIEREEDLSDGSSSRFSSFRKILNIGLGKKEKTLSFDEHGNDSFHKFNHRIVVSGAVFKNRWSNVTSSDLTFLTLEMLNSLSSDRFSTMDRVHGDNLRDKEDMKMKKNKDSSRRSVSEIIAVPRENAFAGSYYSSAASTASTSRNFAVGMTTEEKRRMLWLPIARRTAQWFVNREKSREINTTRQNLNV